MKKLIAIFLVIAAVAGAAAARLGERRVYPHVPPNYQFTASRDPNNWWDDVNDVYTINGTLEVLDVNITGTLDVNDVNITGTLTLEGFTEGSVLFIGADANVAEDNASFFWDDSSNTLDVNGLTVSGTRSKGADYSGGTFADAIQKWPAGTISTTGSTVFKTAVDNTAAFTFQDQDGNSLLTVDSTNDALLYSPTVDKLGTIKGSYNFFLNSATAQMFPNSTPTYTSAIGHVIGNGFAGTVSHNNIIGQSLVYSKTGNMQRNNIVGITIGLGAGANNVTDNNLIGQNIADACTGSVSFNNMVGSVLASGANTSTAYNNMVGNQCANTSTTAVYYNNLVGAGCANGTTGLVAYNNIVGFLLRNGASAADVVFNNMVGRYIARASAGRVSENNAVGDTIADDTTAQIRYNNMVGAAITDTVSGAINYNNLVGANIAGAATTVQYNNIVGLSLADAATGDIEGNYIVGNDQANDVTGTITNSFISGFQCVSNMATGAGDMNLDNVIAFPYQCLRTNTAADLDHAIAIGYQAGLNNAYNRPALFGWGAVANDDDQMVLGSTNYTGGIRIAGTTNYTIFADDGSMSQAGTARIDWTKITANNITQGNGTHSGTTGGGGGLVGDLTVAHDGNFYHIDEAAADPGFELTVEFVSVTAFNLVNILASYDGAATHPVQVSVYNFTNTTWDGYHAMSTSQAEVATPGEYTLQNHDFIVHDDSAYIGTAGDLGDVRVRIRHTAGGNPAHDLDVDVVALYQ